MASCELKFRNLPFEPVAGQVIYIAPSSAKGMERTIRNNYEWLTGAFRRKGWQFCYLPRLAAAAIRYNVPYLTDKLVEVKASHVPDLCDYLVERSALTGPALVFALDRPVTDVQGNTVLQCVFIQKKWYQFTQPFFKGLIKEVQQVSWIQSLNYPKPQPKPQKEEKPAVERCSERKAVKTPDIDYSISEDSLELDDVKYSIAGGDYGWPRDPNTAEDGFDEESKRLVDEIVERINALQAKGVSTMFLKDIITDSQRVSRVKITRDFRIIMMDYNNMQIDMSTLPKAVFLLFLIHPEGIRFKELSDYRVELMKIYQKLSPLGDFHRMLQSVESLTDPCSNSINEKCARIREAFVSKFDDSLAQNYYVTGKKGEPKRITLPRNKVVWEK